MNLVYYLSYSVTIAGIIQFIFLYFLLKNFIHQKFLFKISIDKKYKDFFLNLIPYFFFWCNSNKYFSRNNNSIIQASAVSYLYYADRIYQINLAIAGIAISTVILPQLSKHIAK